MLKGKQKRQLRSLAHHLSPIFQVGKSGVTSEMIQGIRDALEKRELIKVSILQNCEEEKTVIYSKLMDNKEFEVVGMIGRTIIIFKENKENPSISLEWKNI